MKLITLLNTLKQSPEIVCFADTMQVISDHYVYSVTEFSNGDSVNLAGTNEGSCKIFAFAQMHDLSVAQTLHCFGDYYRVDVLQHPDNVDHANIRNFIKHGWQGVVFKALALHKK